MKHSAPTVATVAWLLLAPAVTWAQAPAAPSAPVAPPAPNAPSAPGRPLSDAERAALDDGGASRVRQDLYRILRQYPPSLGEVIQLDPSLIERPDYLAPYPLLAAFLEQHPEVRRSPTYYFGSLESRNVTPQERAMALFESVLAGAAALTAFAVFVSLLVWVIRTSIDHRRWLRQSKVQVEVHTKILDRLSSNEDLLAYAQTPAGSRFLESAPLEVGPQGPAAPLGRIIWSVQAGVVLIVLGIGLWFAQLSLIDEVRQGFKLIATVAASLGVGFVASAAVAYMVSDRVGLIPSKQS
jgi:hypothetical protein